MKTIGPRDDYETVKRRLLERLSRGRCATTTIITTATATDMATNEAFLHGNDLLARTNEHGAYRCLWGE